jgi:hypothetical protein
MVVGDLRVEHVASPPDETDAPPVVDPDAVLPLSVTLERLEPVSRRDSEVMEPPGPMEIQEPSSGSSLKSSTPRNIEIVGQRFGVSATKRLNHPCVRVSRDT